MNHILFVLCDNMDVILVQEYHFTRPFIGTQVYGKSPKVRFVPVKGPLLSNNMNCVVHLMDNHNKNIHFMFVYVPSIIFSHDIKMFLFVTIADVPPFFTSAFQFVSTLFCILLKTNPKLLRYLFLNKNIYICQVGNHF